MLVVINCARRFHVIILFSYHSLGDSLSLMQNHIFKLDNFLIIFHYILVNYIMQLNYISRLVLCLCCF
jgi:hypothetical protein